LYRVVAGQDGSRSVYGCEWLSVTATTRLDALDAARAAVSAWLEVEPEAFDVEALEVQR
jgi:hypothetical protein